MIFVRILILLNWLGGAAILALLTATIVAEQWTFTALGITPESAIPSMIMGLRAIAALGAGRRRPQLCRPQTAARDGRDGEERATRSSPPTPTVSSAIAWVLLALQLLSLAIAAVGKAISTPANPVVLDAGFSINGWLAVLLTFVLARVFAEGTLMREDLEGTV